MTFSERFGNFWNNLKEKDDLSRSIPFFCRSIVIMIVVGVVARIVIGVLMTYVFDVYHWGVIIENINSGNGLYEITGYFYTPPWGYLLGLEALFQNLAGVTVIGERITEVFPLEKATWYYTSTVTTVAFNICIKFMFLISDLVVGYLIFWIIRDVTKDRRKAIMGFALWFLCPFVISVGSVIGMFDTISVLITLLAVIMLRRDRHLEAGVLISLATLMKFFPGFFVFAFIAYILSKNRGSEKVKKNITVFFVGIAITALILLLPQLLDGTISDCFLFITSRVSEGTGAGIIGTIGGYTAMLIYVIALIAGIYFAMRIYKNDDKNKLDGLFFDAILVTTVAMFLYPPLPQYILLLLPFLLLAMSTDKRYNVPFILLIIGTTLLSLGGGPADLVSFAAYTDMLSLDYLMSIIEGYIAPTNFMMLIGYAGGAIQYLGILCIIWIRFGEVIKKKISSHRKVSAKESVTP